MFLAALPFAAASFAMDTYFPARNLVIFLAQTLILLPIFAAAVAFVFREELRERLVPAVRSLLQTKSSLPAQ